MSEQPLPRRAFLGYASLGASAIWMPRWLTAGFARRTAQEPLKRTVMRDGVAIEIPSLQHLLKQSHDRACAAGKPLLVFVVPTDQGCVFERQLAFGQYLNLCDDEAMADLALCEVACAQMADLAAVFPELEECDEPLFVLVETDGFLPYVRSLDARLEEIEWPLFKTELPSFGQLREEREREREELEEFERQVTKRVDRLAALVGAGLASDRRTLERRALQARNALDARREGLVHVLENPAEASVADVDRFAAPLHLAVEEQSDRRDVLIAALAKAARSRLREQPPSGAWWASNTGCGHDIEGYTEEFRTGDIGFVVSCGMGRIPELGRRFLHFYTWHSSR